MHKGSSIKKKLAIDVTSASSHVNFDGLFDFVIFIIIIIIYYYHYFLSLLLLLLSVTLLLTLLSIP